MSISSNGAIYKLPDPKDKKRGVIPSILDLWFNQRKEMRKLAKKYAEEKNTELYEFYDQRQKVQKILLNSVYGTLGLQSFRFFDTDNALAVTLTGQDTIKTAGKAVNQYYRNVLGEDASSSHEYVVYSDTDSIFSSALPVIKHKYPDIDLKDDKAMIDATLKVCSDVQTYVNTTFNQMAKRFYCVTEHRFEAKQEVVARTSFWLAKKKYAQSIINKGGLPCDELEIKGVDIVRTNFPIKFQKFMKEFLIDILARVEKSKLDKKIIEFEKDLSDINSIELAKNTSVKFLSGKGDKNYNPVQRSAFEFLKGTPAAVKAGLAYNDLLTYLKLDKQCPKIFSGQKIKWVYLFENPYGLDAIAIKADDTDPEEIMDFMNQYIDKHGLYRKELRTKLLDFYEILNWAYPNEANENSSVEFSDF